jgi:UDP-glucose 4-epimerase
MRIVVTGAFGFVGRGVVRQLLRAGHEVVALGSPRSTGDVPPARGLTIRRADVRDRETVAELVAGVDGVCHLASRTRVRESFEDPIGYYDTNVGGTIAVLDALDRAGRVPAFVYASTMAVYGVADAYPVTESAPLRPANPYAAGKAAAEALVSHAAAAGMVRAVVLRFANAAGAVDRHGDRDMSRIMPKTVAVASGRFAHLDVNGDGSTRREYVHVLDLADACVRSIERARPGPATVLNIGSGYAASVAEVIRTGREVTGRPITVVHHPPAPEPPIVFADSSRAHDVLGWVPSRSHLARMVADAWQAELRLVQRRNRCISDR